MAAPCLPWMACSPGRSRRGACPLNSVVRQPRTSVVDQSSLLRLFASAIYAKAAGLRKLKSKLNQAERARFLESISDDIKKCTNFVSPGVSQAALDLANTMGVDLCSKSWHEQPRFDPRRKMFHLEHMVPVSKVRELCRDAKSEDAVLEILLKNLRCIWILKSEDRELTRLGYRSRRTNPEAAYKEARINLVQQQPDETAA